MTSGLKSIIMHMAMHHISTRKGNPLRRLMALMLSVLGGLFMVWAPAHADDPAYYDQDWSAPMNQTSYWEPWDCTKYIGHGGWIPSQYDAAIIKAGTQVRVYPDLTNTGSFQASAPGGRNISWVMKCTHPTVVTTSTTSTLPPSTSTTSTLPVTTTTAPSSTTTTSTVVATTTTTPPEATTTVPSSSTTSTSTSTVPPTSSPTTSVPQSSTTTIPVVTTTVPPEDSSTENTRLPETGGGETLPFWATVLICGGWLLVLLTRRTVR